MNYRSKKVIVEAKVRDRKVFGRIVETNCKEGKLSKSPATRVHVAGIYGSEPYSVGSRMIGFRIFYQSKIKSND